MGVGWDLGFRRLVCNQPLSSVMELEATTLTLQTTREFPPLESSFLIFGVSSNY